MRFPAWASLLFGLYGHRRRLHPTTAIQDIVLQFCSYDDDLNDNDKYDLDNRSTNVLNDFTMSSK